MTLKEDIAKLRKDLREKEVFLHEKEKLLEEKNKILEEKESLLQNAMQNQAALLHNLEESERRFHTLTANLPGMVYRCSNDRDWTMEMVSESSISLTGYAPESLIGNKNISYKSIIHPEDQERIWNEVQKALEKKDPYTLMYRIIRQDGQQRWVWEQGRGIFSPVGKVVALEGFITDVSVHKNMEEERVQLERELQCAQKIESIGVLAGGIAHDFNNLLCGIFGNLELAYECSPADNEIRTYLQSALKIFDRAKNLTQQLLTFSKGGSPVKKITSLIPYIKDTIQFVLSGSNITPVFQIPADLWFCDVDGSQIGQVISNISLNARQAMPSGGDIIVSASNISSANIANMKSTEPFPIILSKGNYVRISIQDHGVGIPKEELPRIFDPFFKTKNHSTGLGLAIAYSIVKKHGGTIEAESEMNKGSIFRIYLPASPDASIDSSSSRKNGMESHQLKRRALVMDDEEYIREIASVMLKAMGYAVECVSKGEDAISTFRQALTESKPYDIVILDLTIVGGMGGKDTITKLLELEPGVKAIASSGYSDDPVMANPKQYGFKARLQKPYTISNLRQTLKELV